MTQIAEPADADQDVRETLLAVRAKLKIALHLARDRDGRDVPRKRMFTEVWPFTAMNVNSPRTLEGKTPHRTRTLRSVTDRLSSCGRGEDSII